MYYIDINSDVGESFGEYILGEDNKVIKAVSSVNIACGFHAGDPCVMRKCVEMAEAAGVNIGAHPGLPDLMGFGRRKMNISPSEAKNYVICQIGSLQAFCSAVKRELNHVKIHGALAGMAAKDGKIAEAVIEGILEVNDSLKLYCRPYTQLALTAVKMGINQIADFPVDRAINADHSLVNRKVPGAVLDDVEDIVKRTVRLIKESFLDTYDGQLIKYQVKTICVHGDNLHALKIVEALISTFKKEDIEIRPLHD